MHEGCASRTARPDTRTSGVPGRTILTDARTSSGALVPGAVSAFRVTWDLSRGDGRDSKTGIWPWTHSAVTRSRAA